MCNDISRAIGPLRPAPPQPWINTGSGTETILGIGEIYVHATINGKQQTIEAPPMKRLLDVLREDLHLTGTKEGCGEGECGACAIILNGDLVNSCLIPALQAEGTQITTIEGIAIDERLHPILAKGQIEGGVAQGIGYALYEKCVWQNGHMANNQMTNYIMPTSADLPPLHVHFEETPSPHGPGGAKGIGELPMDGPAPAILNAIEHATGIAFTEIPLLPEDIFERMTSTTDSGTEDLNPTIDRDTRVEPSEVPA